LAEGSTRLDQVQRTVDHPGTRAGRTGVEEVLRRRTVVTRGASARFDELPGVRAIVGELNGASPSCTRARRYIYTRICTGQRSIVR